MLLFTQCVCVFLFFCLLRFCRGGGLRISEAILFGKGKVFFSIQGSYQMVWRAQCGWKGTEIREY